jgi:putative ubiquitin-RnfH superfamily antitoxin RatB of RatAB toxin-antitoxin module
MAASDEIEVTVVYALPHCQALVRLVVPSEATAHTALVASGLLRKFPEIGDTPACAIFGQAVELTRKLRSGDRVEILRPLLIDPKEGRRRAASRTKPNRNRR